MSRLAQQMAVGDDDGDVLGVAFQERIPTVGDERKRGCYDCWDCEQSYFSLPSHFSLFMLYRVGRSTDELRFIGIELLKGFLR